MERLERCREHELTDDSRGLRMWSHVEYVYRCLNDHERTESFRRAIHSIVSPGAVVLDVGFGSGILTLFALDAGAHRVYGIEGGYFLTQISGEILGRHPRGKDVVIIRGDARQLCKEKIEKPDVVICELLTTGLIGEMQGPVINALWDSGLADTQTAFVPASVETSLALARVNFEFYGFHIPFPIFLDYFWKDAEPRHRLLSVEKMAHSVRFSEPFREEVDTATWLDVSQGGRANGVIVKTWTRFTDGSVLAPCVSYCQPVILPIKELTVRKGDSVLVSLCYRMGWGFDSLDYGVQDMRRRSGDDRPQGIRR